MTPLAALTDSFLLGLLHGILPDEHTWPITFSYAIGGASGKSGLRAGLYFSAAFTVQRTLLAEAAYLALAPFLSHLPEGAVYSVVGAVMAVAGAIVVRRNRYVHLHLLGHHHEEARAMGTRVSVLTRTHEEADVPSTSPPPVGWTLVHGFVAGFGFGGFSLFVNTVAVPAMPSAWLGFLPGLLYGLGTMIVLAAIGALFGGVLRWTRVLTEAQMREIGARTGGLTLLLGGLLFSAFGVALLLGLGRQLPFGGGGGLLTAVFGLGIAVPTFLVSWRRVRAAG